MRKIAYIIAVLIVAISCQRGGVVESAVVAGYNAPIVKMEVNNDDQNSGYATKSAFTGSFEVGDAFGVSAYVLESGIWDTATSLPDKLYNKKVELTNLDADGTDTWEYDGVVQWPQNIVDKVKFFAYFPYSSDGANGMSTITTADDDAGYPVVSLPQVAEDPKEQIDYLVAATNKLDKNNGKVALNFKHAYSQITFKANFMLADDTGAELDENEFGENWKATVEAITLYGTKAFSEGYGEFVAIQAGEEADIEFANNENEGFNWTIDYDSAEKQEDRTYELSSAAGTVSELELPYYKNADESEAEFVTINSAAGALILQPQQFDFAEVKVMYTVNLTNTENLSDERNGEYKVTSSVKTEHGYIAGARTTYMATINPFGGVEIFLEDLGVSDWEETDQSDNTLNSGQTDADVSGNGDEGDDWIDGSGNSNDFGDGQTDGDTSGSTGDDWIDGNGNSNDFGDGQVDGNVGDNGNTGWEEEESDNNVGSGLTDGDTSGSTGDDWIDGNGNSNDFGDGQTDGDTSGSTGGDWNDGDGNSNDFGDGQVDGSVDNEESDWEEEKSDNEIGSGLAESDTSGNNGEGGDWTDANGNSNDFGDGQTDGDTSGSTGGDWVGGNGNSNDFGSVDADANTDNVETPDGESWEGDSSNSDNELSGNSSSSKPSIDGDDSWDNSGSGSTTIG